MRRVFITESEINFLAFPPVRDAIVIFGAGYGWDALARSDWLKLCSIQYWGDEEKSLYDDLRDNRIQGGLRLEQEHIGFHWLARSLEQLVDGTTASHSGVSNFWSSAMRTRPEPSDALLKSSLRRTSGACCAELFTALGYFQRIQLIWRVCKGIRLRAYIVRSGTARIGLGIATRQTKMA